MMWKPRKSARPRTLAELHADLSSIPDERVKLERAIGEIEAALPDLLINDPAQAAEASTELAKLRGTLNTIPARENALLERIASFEAEVAEKAADAEHAAMLKRQATSTKRLRAFPDKFAPLLAELEWAVAEVQAFADYNAQRGNRTFIPDPEQEARQIPARTIPAEYRDEVVWEDGAGNQPSVFRQNADGEMVPQELGYTKKAVRVCVQPERAIPASMPPRLAELLPVLKKALGQ